MEAINRYVLSLSPTPASGPIRVVRAATVSSVPTGKPAPGTWRVHMIDVGTGLAILVQGADFTMLFDGGSTDDSRGITSYSIPKRNMVSRWQCKTRVAM